MAFASADASAAAAMSRTERLGFFSKTASGLSSLPSLAIQPRMAYQALLMGEPFTLEHSSSSSSSSACCGAAAEVRFPKSALSRSAGRNSSSTGTLSRTAASAALDASGRLVGGGGITAEALKEEFAAVDARIDDLKQRSKRLGELSSAVADSATRQRLDLPILSPSAAAAASLQGGVASLERQSQRPLKKAKQLKQADRRDPKSTVQRKLEQRREEFEGGSPAQDKHTAQSPVPMMKVQVQRERGVESLALVDIIALKNRSLVSDGQRLSVQSLLEKRRATERSQQLTSMRSSNSEPSLLDGGLRLPSLTWEERFDLVRERKFRCATEKYLQRMNSRREKGGPLPVFEQFEEFEEY